MNHSHLISNLLFNRLAKLHIIVPSVIALLLIIGYILNQWVLAILVALLFAGLPILAIQEKAKYYQHIVDTVQEGIYFVDVNAQTTFVNQRMADMLGYTIEEMQGRSMFEFMDESARVEAEKNLQRCKQGIKEQFDFRFCRKDGSTLWTTINTNSLLDDNGKFEGALGMITDITRHKQAEFALQESLELWQKVLASLNEAVLIVKKDTKEIEQCNKTTELMFGYTQEELINQKVLVLHVNEEMCQHFWHNIELAFDKKEPFETEFQMKRKNGEFFATENVITPLYEKNGQLYKVVSVIRDITERKQAEEILQNVVNGVSAELTAANAELTRAARLKDEFISNMSHELRTPLNAILGMFGMLQEEIYGVLKPQQIKAIDTIGEAANHLLILINGILDLAKIEAGKVKLDIFQIFSEEICKTCLYLVKASALKKHIKITTKYDPNVTIIQADERYLKQILLNLLNNAIKFTPQDGKVNLEIRGNMAEGVVKFIISDTGIGIDEKDMDYLFLPFVQLNGGLNRTHEGTGLGLSLVYRLVEMHGGSVSVTSKPGQASCFTVALPWQPTNGTVIPTVTEKKPESDKILAKVSDVSQNGFDKNKILAKNFGSNKKIIANVVILLVEDNSIVNEMLSNHLKDAGYQVITTYNGSQAIEKAREKHPDVILMDLQIPTMDGLEVTHVIRNDAETATIPIIALTALAIPTEKERCVKAGINKYFVKPVNLQKLDVAIEELL